MRKAKKLATNGEVFEWLSVKGQQDVGTQLEVDSFKFKLFELFAIICADPANTANI